MHKTIGTNLYQLASDPRLHAHASDGLKFCNGRYVQLTLLRGLYYRLSNRVLGLLLNGGNQCQHGIILLASGDSKISQLWFAFGQSTGFINGDDFDIFKVLQRLALAKQDAELRGATGTDHN